MTHAIRTHRLRPPRRAAWVRSVLVLAAAIWLIAPGPQAGTAAVAEPQAHPLTATWPRAKVAQQPGRLADGREFTPLLYLDEATSAGTAPSADGLAIQLLVRSGDGSAHQLQELPTGAGGADPQFTAVTASGDDLIWMVAAVDAAGAGHTTLNRANWRQGTLAVALTSDTGDPIRFNSQYDLFVADGKVHWAAAAPTGQPVTELRSVPLAGGPVEVHTVDGAFAWSAWPWLVSVGSGVAQSVELRNTATGARITVPVGAGELDNCSPTWCRVVVLNASGAAERTELITPNGKRRLRMAGRAATAPVPDVALLDRFELLSKPDANPAVNGVTLLIFDAKTSRLVSVASGVGTIAARGPFVWWSSTNDAAVSWYSLDLRLLR